MDYFSHSEVPSLCLRDVTRTRAFEAAIRRAIRGHGEVVLDAGAGSGILSLFAAAAGARTVYAVEVDEALCSILRETAARNRLDHVIEVICDDVRELRLPHAVDVVLAEMIETWLLDEHQVPALNALRRNGVLAPSAKVIPGRYEAFVEFGQLDFTCYGFDMPFPVHAWADLDADRGWHPMAFRPATDRLSVFDARFDQIVSEAFDAQLTFVAHESGEANAIRLSGIAHLDESTALGPTVAFNGDKLVPIEPIALRAGQASGVRIAAVRGGEGGLGRLVVAPIGGRAQRAT